MEERDLQINMVEEDRGRKHGGVTWGRPYDQTQVLCFDKKKKRARGK